MYNVLLDLTGKRFGRWTVLKRYTKLGYTPIRWECLCDCGNKKIVQGCNIKAGKSTSCGCLQAEIMSKRAKHGCSRNGKTPEYRTWKAMHTRCYNKKQISYSRYGGRGITICDRWSDFKNFLEDMGVKPNGTSIERIDNNKGYCPENCKWATDEEQRSNKSGSRYFKIDDTVLNLKGWSLLCGIPSDILHGRVYSQGLSMKEAINKPYSPRRKSK